MGSPWLLVGVGFVVLAALFWPLERLFPATRGQPLWRQGFGTDLLYWLFTNLVTKALTRASIAAALFVGLTALGRSLDGARLRNGFGPVALQPRWLKVVEVIVIGDLIGYAMHRLLHGRRLWPFHAVHHSPRQLDWLTSVRLHPVADVLMEAAKTVPLVLCGFPFLVLAGSVPFLLFYSSLLHANVTWTFGPFRFVLASPAFHRWHHTSDAEGLDKNFAPLLPLWDLLFGTFYMPVGRQPERFGVHDDGVPEGFLSQLVYPFRQVFVPSVQTDAEAPTPADRQLPSEPPRSSALA